MSDDETFLKHQYDTPVNQHPQVEENNNQHKFTTTCTKDCHPQTESTSLTPLVDQGFSGKAFLVLL